MWTQMNLDPVMLSDREQPQETTYGLIAFRPQVQSRPIPMERKQRVVSSSWGCRGRGGAASGHHISFGGGVMKMLWN